MSEKNSSGTSQKPEFGFLRSMFWPVYRHETKKFLSMSFLMFFILFVYTMVRDIKDSLVRKVAVGGGAEVIPQLKLWFVLPCAFLLVMIYSFLINKFGFKKTFYIIVSSFVTFYIVFVLFLYPNYQTIHANATTVAAMRASWPKFFYWIIPCLTNWSFTLFYIMSELWGTTMISSLFWQFAYEVTMKNEVKRFFGTYAIIGNIGVTFSGGLLKWTAKNLSQDASINVCVGTCILFGIIVMLIFWYINAVVLNDPNSFDPSQVKPKKKKEKVGIMDGIKILCKSPYLFLVCALVLCYGVGINFFELVWKKCQDNAARDANGVSSMMSDLSMLVGILTIVASLVGQTILRKTSWKKAALIPALILGVFGVVLFAIVIYGENVSPVVFGMNYYVLAVWVGLFINALSKSVKYCLFDATKNMAYVPLDDETRTKGQAAVEVIGGRAGKAGASAVGMFLTSVVSAGSQITDHVVTIGILFVATVGIWVSSIFNLSKQYEVKVKETNSIE